LNFLLSTKKTTEYSGELFLSIYRYLIFFFQVLNFTSVERNRFAKQPKLLKNLFFKSDAGRAKKAASPKAPRDLLPRKDGIPHPPQVVLPSPRVCTGEHTVAPQQKFLRMIGYHICLAMLLR